MFNILHNNNSIRAIMQFPDLTDEPLAVKTLYPDPDLFSTWDETRENGREEIESELDGNPDIVGITHTDADGYGCEVMLREAFPKKDVRVVTASASGPLSMEFVGKIVYENIRPETPLYIMDLSPNNGRGRQFIDGVRNLHNVFVMDHHEWEESDCKHIEWVAEVHHDTERCATQIVHDVLIDSPRKEITELADLTADHDLWIKEMREESDALNDLSKYLDRADYVNLAREHGADVINTPEGAEYIREKREERNKITEITINRATYTEINGYDVAITYGDCEANDVGEKLYEGEDGVDIACIIYPNGNISVRTREEVPVARDIVTYYEKGGGHPNAAGATINLVGESIEYTAHWATMGSEMRKHVIEGMKEVL